MFENGMTFAVPNQHRLQKIVVPRHYAVTIRPDFETRTFTGGEVIDIKVKHQTPDIRINSKDLLITAAHLTDDHGTRLNGTVSYDEEHEVAIIAFEGGSVGKGKWQLHLSFNGQVTDRLHGLYSSVYTGPDGKLRTVFSTQMEPCDARRLFPCFDEPAFKATLALTLITDPNLQVFANGAIAKESIVEESKEMSIDYGNGLRYVIAPARRKRITHFKTTMKQSTYLTAVVIGDFDVSKTVKVNNIPVRVICPRGKVHMATVALRTAQFAINWCEKAFQIKYPGKKLDLIGVSNFPFGAMENSDAIIFRDIALLVDEKTATFAELLRVAYTVAHEIVHQWFGNLVTMEWWDDLWLNEAFATLMGYIIAYEFCKEWDQWTAAGVARANALRIDGLLSSRAVQGKVLKARDATGAFDPITYRKGATVLRQLLEYIGWVPFRNGVRKYLKDHAFGNTVGRHLWEAIEKVSGHPVGEIMDHWINQAGHPIITVSESDVDGSITLTQRPFKYLADQADNSLMWHVPVKLRFKTASETDMQGLSVLLTEQEQTVYLGEDIEYVVANADACGFYRVQYSPSLMSKLKDGAQLQSRLTAPERYSLLDDTFACMQAGLLTAADYVEVVRLFADETNPYVWSLISSTLGRLHRMLPQAQQFESFVRDLAQPTLTRLGYEPRQGEPAEDGQVRGTVIALLGTSGADTAVQAKAKELFCAYKENSSAVAPDLVAHAIKVTAHSGDPQVYDELRKLLAATSNGQEIVRYIAGITSFRNQSELLQSTLQALLDGAIRSQDACSAVAQLLANPVTSRKTWQFIKDNWDHIVTNFPVNNLATLVEGLANFDSPAIAGDVERFMADHKVPGGDKTVEQTLESLRINVRLHEREAPGFRTAFAVPAATTKT
jgi:puromycin-sensitive aminopeptidase